MNVDLGWPLDTGGHPRSQTLLHAGVRHVRFVSHEGQGASIADYADSGIYTLGVVTKDSAGVVCAADAIQIGNEPNLPNTGDSMQPTGDDPDVSFAARLQLFRDTYPEKLLIAGGLANWGSLADRVAYITAVRNAGGLAGYSAVAVHYPPSASQITAIARAAGIPCWVTEWHVSYEQQAEYQRSIRQVAPLEFAFCWDDGMEKSFGFSGEMKRLYAA